MPTEADAQKVPLNDEGDLSVSEERAMAARVAAAKERYREAQPVHPHHPNPLGASQLSYIMEQVQASDAAVAVPRTNGKRPDGPLAPVQRRGPSPGKARPPDPLAPLNDPPPAAVEPPKPRKRKAKVPKDISDEQLLAESGIVRYYSTKDVAQFFDRSEAWVYWGLGRDDETPPFLRPDGSPIAPERVGATHRRRYTLADIRDILLASNRRGNVTTEELTKVLRRIRIDEYSGDWREREGWTRHRGRWVPPKSDSEDER